MLCVVIFRGSWDKYDKHFLQKIGHFIKTKKEEVSLIAWTSGGEEEAKKADTEWGLTKDCGFKLVLGDSTSALATYLVDDYILPKLKTMTLEEAKVTDLAKAELYPNGLVQPGIVCFAHHGAAPVFEWEHPCNEPGLGGPDRPDPEGMWEIIMKRKHALDSGNDVVPSHGTNLKMCSNDSDIAS